MSAEIRIAVLGAVLFVVSYAINIRTFTQPRQKQLTLYTLYAGAALLVGGLSAWVVAA